MKQACKIKRAVITSIAAVCALSSAAAISGSATSYSYTVSVAYGNTVVHGIPSASGSTHKDTFASYPTIFDSKSSSTVSSWVSTLDHKYNSSKKTSLLQSSSASSTSVNYGVWSYSGETYHNFNVTSGGGFRDTVTTVVS